MIQNFLYSIKTGQGLSENTVLSYQYDLEAFWEYLQQMRVQAPQDINKAQIVSYLFYLKRAGRASATILRNAASIKRYCKYLLQEGILQENPCEGLTLPKAEPRFIAPPDFTDVQMLLGQIDDHSVKGKRDKAMVSLVAGTGMQASELLALNLEHVRPDAALLQYRKGKGEQFYPLPENVCSHLLVYLRESRPHLADQEEPALFVNFSGQRMTRQGFWKIVSSYREKAHLETAITPRNLRHTLPG